MIKYNFSEIRISLFILFVSSLFFVACSKSGGSGGGSGPVLPPTPPTPVINMPTMPSTPLWNGDGFSGTYSVSNAPSGSVLKLNGSVVPTSGSVNLTNLTGPTNLQFVLSKSATDGSILTSSSTTVPVAGSVLTTLGKDPVHWKNTFIRDSAYSGNTWVTFPPLCEYWKFNSDNTCTIILTHCGIPGNTISHNVVNTGQNVLTIGGTDFIILSLTSTTLVVRINGPYGATELTWQAQF